MASIAPLLLPNLRARRAAAVLAVLAAFLAAPRPAAPADPLAAELAAAVESARRVSPELGVHVVDAASGETIFELAADHPRVVASNAKLVTSAAALDVLGPGHFFETRVLFRGRAEGEILRGDLAVVGGGDPNLSGRHHEGDAFAVFRRWAAALSALGVRRIEGDVYLVHGFFEPPEVHPDWPRDQLSRWYEAPVSALSFNDNCVLVRVWPGQRSGRPARVETIPSLPLFRIDNRAATTSSARRHLVAIDRSRFGHLLTVNGAVFNRGRPVESWVAVPDPVRYFGAGLREGLAQEGLEITGEMRPVASLPDARLPVASPSVASPPEGGWRQLDTYRSDLLSTLEVINKRSQNFYAESVVKLLGAERCGSGTWQAGLRVVAEFLERVGIQPGSYELADGSGMSRGNRFSPRQLTTLLRHMFYHPLSLEYLRSLPHSGERGLQWEDRLSEPPYRGNVFAKTGYLRRVSTLTGYAKSSSGRIYAFSLLSNDVRDVRGAKRAQDRILRVLIDRG